MATREQIKQAFLAAHASGDTEAARKLAEAYRAASAPRPGAISAETDARAVENAGGVGAAIRGGLGGIRDVAAGALRGAGSIGATIIAPGDMAADAILPARPDGQTRNEARRAAMTEALGQLGADTNSGQFKGGKIGSEIAGTAGIGSVVANGARAVGLASQAPRLVAAIESGGFQLGAPARAGVAGRVADLATRAAGGAISGGATAAAVNPADAGEGAAVGAAVPVAGRFIGGAAVRAGRTIRDGIARTPAAQRLLNAGVELTPGMLRQQGVANRAEQVYGSIPILQNVVGGARENALRSWQRAVLRMGAAPGAAIPDGNVDDMLTAAYNSFDAAYAPVRNILLPAPAAARLPALLARTATDPAIPADDALRTQVANWLTNQATRVGSVRAPTTSNLLDLRSQIRAQIRRDAHGGNLDRAALLERAERLVTVTLDRTIPVAQRTALRETDRQYARYKIAETAMARAKDRASGFSPEDLSQAVASGAERGSYARGAGGPMRQMARDAKATITGTEPKTGYVVPAAAGLATAAASRPEVVIPMLGAHLGAITTRTGRRIVSGQTRPQQYLRSLPGVPGAALERIQQGASRALPVIATDQ